MAEDDRLDALAAEQGVGPVSDRLELAGPLLPTADREAFLAALAEGAREDFNRGRVAGAEAAARTIEAVAAEWKAPPEQAGAVRLFADMVAKAVRGAAVTVTEEPR